MERGGSTTGGIFAALSSSTAQVAAEAMDAAHEFGTPVSYDLNYRESLWKSIGGKSKAQAVNRDSSARLMFCLAMKKTSPRCWACNSKGLPRISPNCRWRPTKRCCAKLLRFIQI